MERLLHDLPGVTPYFNDILVSANDEFELTSHLRAVLHRFHQTGVKLKPTNCKLGVPQVEFLGYLIDAAGLHPAPSKVQAIRNAPTPTNKPDLQSFLGLLNFCNSFLHHKAMVAEPLRCLLDKRPLGSGDVEKLLLSHLCLPTSDSVLVQYNNTLPLTLTCDVSPYGVGAVLSHWLPNGTKAPITYFSRTLSATERNYGHIDKEALAIVAGVKRFNDYLYGHFLHIFTNNKLLLGILAGDHQTPPILSPRMTRWLVFLNAYNYHLVHHLGKDFGNTDTLSSCPLPVQVDNPASLPSILQIDDQLSPMSALDVARYTVRNTSLHQVLDWVRRRWPQGQVTAEFQPYKCRQQELSSLRGCLLSNAKNNKISFKL